MPRKPKKEEDGKLNMEVSTPDEQHMGVMQDKLPTLEESFEELDKIIAALEENSVSLEESFRLYHKGMDVLKQCNSSIDKIEKELIILEESGIDIP